jgi:anti-sigma factor RsiW
MSGANCKPFVMLISARIDGALDAARFGQLAEHLADCASCRARERSLLAQGQALRAGSLTRLAALEASGKIDLTGFADRVLRAATQRERPAHPTRWERLALSLRERWEHQRLALSASLGVAGAGLATVFFVLVLPRVLAPHGMPASAQPELAAGGSQASIDTIELMRGTTGLVFEVPGQTTVIWVSEEAAE